MQIFISNRFDSILKRRRNVVICRTGFHRRQSGGGSGFKGMIVKLSVAAVVLLICTLSLFFSSTGTSSNLQSNYRSEVRAIRSESLYIFFGEMEFVLIISCNSAICYSIFVQIRLEELWSNADSGGWRPSSAPRTHWPRIYLVL